MIESPASTRHHRQGHPTQREVEAVLDREADAGSSARLRAHVEACPPCSQRYGAWFELECWAPALSAPPSRIPSPAAGRRRLAIAAALLLALGLGLRMLWPEADPRAGPSSTEPARPRPTASALRLLNPQRLVIHRHDGREIQVRTTAQGGQLVRRTRVIQPGAGQRHSEHRAPRQGSLLADPLNTLVAR